ncbi:C-Myc-binding protein [Collichthys lucidus]|uniref:c-Myc-binding protein n=1 Tax=Collichthys lucidus TaxID=240159 RepID=A0A4U5V5B5_COLLU|nr:C-Myc-binding protein [Collichthys lucidus]
MRCTSRQASDPKREQFRRYLEKAGVVDSLTSVSLYEQQEKPTNALEYPSIHATRCPHIVVWLHEPSLGLGGTPSRFVKEHLGAPGLASADTEALQQEVIDLRQRCARLAEENKDLKTKLWSADPCLVIVLSSWCCLTRWIKTLFGVCNVDILSSPSLQLRRYEPEDGATAD